MESTKIDQKNIITAFGLFKAGSFNEEERTVEFIISNETRDRDGDIISIDAWRLDNYKANPIVCYQHDTGVRWNESPDPNVIIGHCVDVRKEDNQLIGVVKFDREVEEKNELAEKIFRKVQRGTLRATSVGFTPLDGHWGDIEDGEDSGTYYLTDVELLEFSIVALPSNPTAIVRSYSGKIDAYKSVKEEPDQNDTAENKEETNHGHNHGHRLRIINLT